MSDDWIGSYRLQLHAGFTLEDAERVVPYLADLGISHLYLSPCLQAVPGSVHGYDVADPSHISRDLGGERAWARFVEAARSRGLAILLDIVPNHMSASAHNRWWDDVLAHGPYSEYAGYFDIHRPPGQPFCVHICTLAHSYGESLAQGELSIELQGEAARAVHFDNSWPLGPASWGTLLGDSSNCFAELERLRALPEAGPEECVRYRHEAASAQSILEEARRAGRLARALARVRGDPDELHAILECQFFKLHGWKLAGELTNYRRFFDIGALAGIRTECARVFEATHRRVERMISERQLDGLRIDHPDGLRDPCGYFERLRGILPRGRIYVEKI